MNSVIKELPGKKQGVQKGGYSPLVGDRAPRSALESPALFPPRLWPVQIKIECVRNKNRQAPRLDSALYLKAPICNGSRANSAPIGLSCQREGQKSHGAEILDSQGKTSAGWGWPQVLARAPATKRLREKIQKRFSRIFFFFFPWCLFFFFFFSERSWRGIQMAISKRKELAWYIRVCVTLLHYWLRVTRCKLFKHVCSLHVVFFFFFFLTLHYIACSKNKVFWTAHQEPPLSLCENWKTRHHFSVDRFLFKVIQKEEKKAFGIFQTSDC